MPSSESGAVHERWQAVVVAFCVTIAATQIGRLAQQAVDGSDWYERFGFSSRSQLRLRHIALLGFGLVLVSTARRRSGVTLGTGKNVGKAVLVCLLVIAAVAVYRDFPFDGSQRMRLFQVRTRFGCPARSSWLISPLAQELVFSGFILGYLQSHFPSRLHRRLPITGAVVITALLFGLWHFVPDFIIGRGSAGFAAFRVAYTTAGMVVYGVVRLWTGTIAYAVATHTVVNYMFFGGFTCVTYGLG